MDDMENFLSSYVKYSTLQPNSGLYIWIEEKKARGKNCLINGFKRPNNAFSWVIYRDEDPVWPKKTGSGTQYLTLLKV